MLTTTLLTSALALSVSAYPQLQSRQTTNTSTTDSSLSVVDAQWDGQCFYPKPDADFSLGKYFGRWFQVAGTVAPFTAGCTCVYAQYSLNTNGTVNVANGCQLGNRSITIQGTASPADEIYGEDGVFRVQFPGQPGPDCPGPNYVVQDYEETDNGTWAIVQTQNFSTLFLLSRVQNPPEADISAWLERAGQLGSNLTEVVRTNQTGCLFT